MLTANDGNNFELCKGVYVYTDTGDNFGPFDSVAEAITVLQEAVPYLDEDVDVLHIGARFVKQTDDDRRTTRVESKVSRYFD